MSHSNYVSNILTNSIFTKGPKRKITNLVFKSFIQLTYQIAESFAYIVVIQLFKKAQREGWTMPEVQGQLEIELKDSWSKLCKTKIGQSCYKNIDLEDIISADDPVKIIQKGIRY